MKSVFHYAIVEARGRSLIKCASPDPGSDCGSGLVKVGVVVSSQNCSPTLAPVSLPVTPISVQASGHTDDTPTVPTCDIVPTRDSTLDANLNRAGEAAASETPVLASQVPERDASQTLPS